MSNNLPDLHPASDSDLRDVQVSTYCGAGSTCLQLAQGPAYDADYVHMDMAQIVALHRQLGALINQNMQRTGRAVRRNPFQDDMDTVERIEAREAEGYEAGVRADARFHKRMTTGQ